MCVCNGDSQVQSETNVNGSTNKQTIKGANKQIDRFALIWFVLFLVAVRTTSTHTNTQLDLLSFPNLKPNLYVIHVDYFIKICNQTVGSCKSTKFGHHKSKLWRKLQITTKQIIVIVEIIIVMIIPKHLISCSLDLAHYLCLLASQLGGNLEACAMETLTWLATGKLVFQLIARQSLFVGGDLYLYKRKF